MAKEFLSMTPESQTIVHKKSEEIRNRYRGLLKEMEQGECGEVPYDQTVFSGTYDNLFDLFSEFEQYTLNPDVDITHQDQQLRKTMHVLIKIAQTFTGFTDVQFRTKIEALSKALSRRAKEKIKNHSELPDDYPRDEYNTLKIIPDPQSGLYLFQKDYRVVGEPEKGVGTKAIPMQHRRETLALSLNDNSANRGASILFGIQKEAPVEELIIVREGSLQTYSREVHPEPTSIRIPTASELYTTTEIIRQAITRV